MGFPRQEYWSGLPFPPPGHLSNPGSKLREQTQVSCITGKSLLSEPPGNYYTVHLKFVLYVNYINIAMKLKEKNVDFLRQLGAFQESKCPEEPSDQLVGGCMVSVSGGPPEVEGPEHLKFF